MCSNIDCKNIRDKLIIGVKLNESKSQIYRKLLSECSCGGPGLAEIMPDIFEQHMNEIKEIIQEYEERIENMKEEYGNKIKMLSDQCDDYKIQITDIYEDIYEEFYGDSDESEEESDEEDFDDENY
jgi:hypothetical protein|tara:strand:- start:1188 stop:1565 length:378 start_codon:yes stop_codon:yes gene_type:complete